jgi:hypothetical protein
MYTIVFLFLLALASYSTETAQAGGDNRYDYNVWRDHQRGLQPYVKEGTREWEQDQRSGYSGNSDPRYNPDAPRHDGLDYRGNTDQ